MKKAYMIYPKSYFRNKSFKRYLRDKIVKDRARVRNETIDEAIEIVKSWKDFDFGKHYAVVQLIIDELNSKKVKDE